MDLSVLSMVQFSFKYLKTLTPTLVITLSQNLNYAEDGPHVTCTSLQPLLQADKVQNTPLTRTAFVNPLAQPSHCQWDVGGSILLADVHVITWFRSLVPLTDGSVCLDQILIQLKEVAPQWRELAEAVGVEKVDEVSDYVRKTLEC